MLHPHDLAVVHDDDLAVADILLTRIGRGEGSRELLVAELVASLSMHVAAVDAVIVPALDRHVDGIEQRSAQLGARHRRIANALSTLESTSGPEADAAVAEVHACVTSGNRELLDALRAAVGDDQMQVIGREFVHAKRHAPTRPHPNANGSILRVVGMIDRVKDVSSGRDMLAATDGSGILEPESQAVINVLAELAPKRIELLEPDEARRQPAIIDAVNRVLEDRGEDILPLTVGRVDDITITTDTGDLATRIYDASPAPDHTKPVVLYIHGGGWVTGDIYAADASPRGVALAVDAIVVSVGYRLAPEHPFPAAHDDVAAALRWLRSNAASIGGDGDRIAIVAEGAGANMAVAACAASIRSGEAPPRGLVLVCPIVSARLDTESCRTNADAKPLSTAILRWSLGTLHPDPAVVEAAVDLGSIPDADLAGFPPTMVITAERDPLHDEGVALAERLKAVGVVAALREYRGVAHDFLGTARVVAAGRDALAATATLLHSLFTEPV